ncbi:MAG: transglycosylase SLT domain-containing protein [bacterium]|nr:transglycosylase SLT domain-containing protein [bacterium]
MTIASPVNSHAVLMANMAMPLVQTVQAETPPEKTVAELIKEEAEAQGIDPKLATTVAYCESTWRQFDQAGEPLRGLHNAQDVGLFQINESYHLSESQKLGYDIYSTAGNIAYAMYLVKKDGFRPWQASKTCWGKNEV